jgi:hypothetical protein
VWEVATSLLERRPTEQAAGSWPASADPKLPSRYAPGADEPVTEGDRPGAGPASVAAADISACLPESVGQGSLVTKDQREVCRLSPWNHVAERLNPYPARYRPAFAYSLLRYPPPRQPLLRVAFPGGGSDGLTGNGCSLKNYCGFSFDWTLSLGNAATSRLCARTPAWLAPSKLALATGATCPDTTFERIENQELKTRISVRMS